MEQLMAVKVGCLVALLALTLIVGLIPPFFSWFLKSSVKGTYQLVICLISSFAAGTFLGACLLHVVAEALSSIATELSYIAYPMGELILSLGFFFVLFIERIVLQFCYHSQPQQLDGSPVPATQNSPEANSTEKQEHPEEINNAAEVSHNHIHVNLHSYSSFRSLILFLSLSVHSVFEGLAIGLQSNYSSALQIAIAVLIHKGVIVFSLSLKLTQSKTRPLWLLVYVITLSLMSPIGITIGIIVTLKKTTIITLVQAVLEGIASGTFVYVTFLEILPQELNTAEKPLLKLLFIALGFTAMAVIAIWA
ncbi:hypothetical protein XENTR_v10002153 [Xenopus tropicalis]|uniref:Solute carrier family 39 (zinc transporter), member 2 n=1 Tax=Xenopus tropicalis TaxID=8364 RepID=F6RAP0_XENTR|nr:zinc transporter ZIP2 [Xenopus tropicalis]KAE8633929.1 hypothetical protein XENTR_v10002153 [Xenopus tropicalis]|eukprot:XP_002934324.1 PREDICTED: zinc transporter ZIP2 [Xenopus tropicalis]